MRKGRADSIATTGPSAEGKAPCVDAGPSVDVEAILSAVSATGASVPEIWEAMKASDVPMAQLWSFMLDRIVERANHAASDAANGWNMNDVRKPLTDDIFFLRAKIRSDMKELEVYRATHGPEFDAPLQSHRKLADLCDQMLNEANYAIWSRNNTLLEDILGRRRSQA